MSLAAFQETPAAYQVAHESGIKSGQVRRQNAERLKRLDALLPEILPALHEKLQEPDAQTKAHTGALEMLSAHIARIDDKLSHAEEPADFRDLAQARSKLFEQWAHLAGIPKPMAAREVRTTRRTYAAPAAPVEIPAIPQP